MTEKILSMFEGVIVDIHEAAPPMTRRQEFAEWTDPLTPKQEFFVELKQSSVADDQSLAVM